MKKILMKAMMTSISEVMETMFFLPVEFGGESTIIQSEQGKNKSLLTSRLKFNGDVTGSLCILVPKDLIGEMAENFIGESQDQLTDSHLTGTLTELLNMICGNALSKVTSKVPFKLGIPEVINETEFSEKEKFTIIETTQSKMAILLKIN